jgi:hypothetical protein
MLCIFKLGHELATLQLALDDKDTMKPQGERKVRKRYLKAKCKGRAVCDDI